MAGAKKGNRLLWMFGAIGLLLFVFFTWTDPSWRATTPVTRDKAIAIATAQWLYGGVTASAYDVQATLGGDTNVDGYLTKHGLHETYDKLTDPSKRAAPLVYWTVAQYQKAGSRIYTTQIDADTGRVIGYTSNTPVGGVLPRDVAQGQAEQALRAIGLDPGALKLLSTKQGQAPTPKPRGTTKGIMVPSTPNSQYTFTYEDPHIQVGALQLHYVVTLTGSRVTELKHAYIVPTDFTAWHEGQEKMGGVLTLLSFLLSALFVLLALIFLFVIREKKPYTAAFWLALLTFVLYLVSMLNQLPVFGQQIFSKIASPLLRTLSGSLGVLLVIFLSVAVAAATYVLVLTGGMLVRQVKERLWTARTDPAFAQRIRTATWRGYVLAVAWLGFQGLFYWVGDSVFGVWSENDFSMTPTNMLVPALFPLMAWMAGIQEELTYRMFGVTFFKRYFKNTFLAVLLPAMVWALGHSLYPVYPMYTRFIELTIFGAVIGYCYLWYGIETVIFAHVVFDSIQMCLPLVASGEVGQIIGGAAFLVLPAIVGTGISLWRPRRKPDILDFDVM